MRKLLFKNLIRRRSPIRRPPPTRPRLPSLRQRRPCRASPARTQPCDPRGRRRLLQWLRAGDPRAQQRLLRSRALRPAFRRLAAPCRRADGDGPVTKNMREALERTYNATPDPKWVVAVGDCAAMAGFSRIAMRWSGGVSGGRARRSPHPRLPAAAGAVAQGPARPARPGGVA